MQNLEDLKVSLFSNHLAYSNALVTLKEIVRLVRYDKNIAANTESYRKTMAVMGKKHADTNIKQKLMPVFGVAVTFHGIGHSQGQADYWTGLALCDLDHFETKEALEAAIEQLISIRLRRPIGNEPYQLMSAEMINMFLNYGRHNHQFSNRKIGDIMRNLEFKYIHKKTGNYYKVVEIPLNHQQVFIAEDSEGQSFER